MGFTKKMEDFPHGKSEPWSKLGAQNGMLINPHSFFTERNPWVCLSLSQLDFRGYVSGEQRARTLFGTVHSSEFLGVTSPFFPGILLSRKQPEALGKWLVFEKNDG